MWYCYKCKGWLGRGRKGFRSHVEMWWHLREHHQSSLNSAKASSKAEPLILLLQGSELLTQILSENCERPVIQSKE